MTPSPRELHRRRLAIALLARSVMTVSDLHDSPMIGTLSLSIDLTHLPRVDAALAPPLDSLATVLADATRRFTR